MHSAIYSVGRNKPIRCLPTWRRLRCRPRMAARAGAWYRAKGRYRQAGTARVHVSTNAQCAMIERCAAMARSMRTRIRCASASKCSRTSCAAPERACAAGTGADAAAPRLASPTAPRHDERDQGWNESRGDASSAHRPCAVRTARRARPHAGVRRGCGDPSRGRLEHRTRADENPWTHSSV